MVDLITCKNEEDPIKKKVLGCSQHNTLTFQTLNDFSDAHRPAKSVVSGGMWPKFEHIHAFIVVSVTSKNEGDPFKSEGARVSQLLSHCKSVVIFQTLKGSQLHCPCSDLTKFLTLPSFYGSYLLPWKPQF